MSYVITRNFAKNAKEKYGIECVAVGGSQKEGKQSCMQVHFQTNQSLTIDSGRSLVLKLVDEFLFMINENKKIRKYLIQYPFTCQNVDIILGGAKIPEDKDNYIDFLSSSYGFIKYFQLRSKEINCGVILKEKYEEALKIANSIS